MGFDTKEGWQKGSEIDVTRTEDGRQGQIWMLRGRSMADRIRYKCYIEEGWQIGSDMDVICMKDGRKRSDINVKSTEDGSRTRYGCYTNEG